MIIWGTKYRELVERNGTFFCPECMTKTSFKLKKCSKYFTLYFIPIFELENIGRFVECDNCESKFKEEVLDSKPGIIFENLHQEDTHRFIIVYDLASTHIALSCMLVSDQLENINNEQERCFLAFELGVLEYYSTTILNLTEEDRSYIFSCFLDYYSDRKYKEKASVINQFWLSIAINNNYLRERKLGFESLNDRVNMDGTIKNGFYPGGYLQKAIEL